MRNYILPVMILIFLIATAFAAISFSSNKFSFECSDDLCYIRDYLEINSLKDFGANLTHKSDILLACKNIFDNASIRCVSFNISQSVMDELNITVYKGVLNNYSLFITTSRTRFGIPINCSGTIVNNWNLTLQQKKDIINYMWCRNDPIATTL